MSGVDIEFSIDEGEANEDVTEETQENPPPDPPTRATAADNAGRRYQGEGPF